MKDQIAKLEEQNANLLKLLHDHQNHWNTIGWAFGLCMGGIDGDDVTDLHGNAALIIEHCLNVAERARQEQKKRDAEIARTVYDRGYYKDAGDKIAKAIEEG